MCIHNIQGGNLLGKTRILEVFGVKSRAVGIDEADDFKDLELPFLCSTNNGSFILVTGISEAGPVYTDGKHTKKSDWDLFLKEVRMLSVMLSAKADASVANTGSTPRSRWRSWTGGFKVPKRHFIWHFEWHFGEYFVYLHQDMMMLYGSI